MRGPARSGRRAAIAAIACGACALSALAAPATAAWLVSTDVSLLGGTARDPQAAFDGDGNATAVWEVQIGSAWFVRAADRPAGGAWTAAVEISPPGGRSPKIAVDARGTATAVWEASRSGGSVVQASQRPLGGAWQAPVDISAPAGSLPQLAVGPQGDAVVVWQRDDGGGRIVQASYRPPGGAWQPPVSVSPAGAAPDNFQVAVGAAGQAIAVWQRYDDPVYRVQASYRPPGGAWSAPVYVSPEGVNGIRPQVAFDRLGNATAIWLQSSGTQWRVYAADRPAATGAWQNPVTISPPGVAGTPDLAVAQSGAATAAWHLQSGTSTIVQAAQRSAGGSWQTPLDLTSAGTDSWPKVAVGADGSATVVWKHASGGAQGTHRPAGTGEWQAPVDLSAPGSVTTGPAVAAGPGDDALAVWTRATGGDFLVRAAAYDGTGPQLRSLAIPARGVAGRPVAFSVAPLDVLSALGQTTWGFGDGAVATGTQVTHTYTSPGSYTVTVTSADAQANISTRQQTIIIDPAPAGPPPQRQAPKLTSLKQTHSVWRTYKAPANKRPKLPVGTAFSVRSDQSVKLSFSFSQQLNGRKVAGKCVAQTKKNHKAKPCTRAVARGTIARNAGAGIYKLAFIGKLNATKKLKPGRYTLAVTATGNDGQRSQPQQIRFTIAS